MTTHPIQPPERLRADSARVWNDAMQGPMWDADLEQLSARFEAESHVLGLGTGYLLALSFRGRVALRRDARRVHAQDRRVGIGVSVIRSGQAVLRCGGRELRLGAGDACLVSGQEPFEKVISGDYREHFLMVPAETVDRLLGGRAARGPARISSREGGGRLLSDYLASLAGHGTCVAPGGRADLAASVVSLVAATFVWERSADACSATREAQRQRVRRHARRHLRDPSLGPAAVAEAQGFSVRYLHLLFEETEETFMEWVREERLQRCREALRSPVHAHLGIGEIAFAWGFNSHSHFSRLFRKRFGTTPSAFRARRGAATKG